MLSYLPILASLAGCALSQRVQISDLTQSISVSGGFGGLSTCRVGATLDRGGQPVNLAVAETCDNFQDSGISGGKWFEFPEADGLRVRISCNVQNGDCGQNFDIRVEANDNYCNQGRTSRKDCPITDFRVPGGANIVARQDPPTNTAPDQCYEDVLLDVC